MKITLTEFVTLDGVSQGPGSPAEDTGDGFTRGGWLVPHMDEMFVRRVSDWLDLADGLLLGRRTYEAFARDWPKITDPADPFAERMNTLPKYVVTNTLTEGTWNPTIVLNGDPVHAVTELKARPGRELQIHGSARLVIAPAVLRTGRRLLAGAGTPSGLRLLHHEATPNGLLLLEYEVTGQARQGEYEGVAAFT
ncbi:dihydrofolate reductase family protein [Thermomonospora amylolytica]|uniref:dihydrofolate reductase family protein n=1 Tax=Thermomonospora amylolytica TaxID=1411117 RepID=UPI000E6BDE04|nr:dihydrofolate reductase family protein [Thermomonospora amylolytica]